MTVEVFGATHYEHSAGDNNPTEEPHSDEPSEITGIAEEYWDAEDYNTRKEEKVPCLKGLVRTSLAPCDPYKYNQCEYKEGKHLSQGVLPMLQEGDGGDGQEERDTQDGRVNAANRNEPGGLDLPNDDYWEQSEDRPILEVPILQNPSIGRDAAPDAEPR